MFNHKEVYDWYNLPAVKFEIIKFLKDREMCMINKETNSKTVRMLKCHSVQHFDFINKKMLKVEEQNTLYNYYYSLARYKDGIPNQSPKLSERDNSLWNETHFKEIIAYDFLIDIDGEHETIDFTYESAKEILNLFDKLRVPFELRFSGRGFHFIIPFHLFGWGNYFSFYPDNKNNIYSMYYKIAWWLFNNVSEMVDYSIYDSRRVTKIPYSIAIYHDEGNYLCYPFKSREQFNNFKLDDMKVSNINKNEIRGRGTYMFNEMGNAYNLVAYIIERGGIKS